MALTLVRLTQPKIPRPVDSARLRKVVQAGVRVGPGRNGLGSRGSWEFQLAWFAIGFLPFGRGVVASGWM